MSSPADASAWARPSKSSTGSTETAVSDSPDIPAADGSVQQVAASVLPSVVKINVTGAQGAGSGSGIVLSETGEILTNNHVVEVADGSGRISVSFSDGTTAPVEQLLRRRVHLGRARRFVHAPRGHGEGSPSIQPTVAMTSAQPVRNSPEEFHSTRCVPPGDSIRMSRAAPPY